MVRAWPEKVPDDLPPDFHKVVNKNMGVLSEKLGMRIEEISRERVVATMPVEGNTQPMGILHGGATMSLIETLASTGSALVAWGPDRVVMGQNQICHYLATASDGTVRGVAVPLPLGRTTPVWDGEGAQLETG